MPKRSCSKSESRSKKQKTSCVAQNDNNVSEYTLLGPIKIPLKSIGYVYDCGDADGCVRVEVWLDPSCHDSKLAYPTLKAVADHFGPADLQLKVHLFPLPYHRNSHVITKGAHVISEYKAGAPFNGSDAVFAWMDAVYANLDKLTPTATAKMNDGEVLDVLLAPMAKAVCGVGPAAFASAVAPHTPADAAARLAWKYGCTRGVYGTPMFTLNDVFVSADPSWTVERWVALIKPLVTQARGGR